MVDTGWNQESMEWREVVRRLCSHGRFMSASFRLGLICTFPLVVSACVSPRVERGLAANAAIQKEEFGNLFGRIKDEPEAAISWNAAYQQMLRSNLSLRQSRKQLEDAEKLTRRQWLSLVPKVAGFLNVGTSISALTNLESDDLNARLIANFNIPNPFEFHASLYGAALQGQNAKWSHELDQRRAYAQLYSAFVDARRIGEAEAMLDRRRQTLMDAEASDIGKRLKSVASEVRGMERRRLYHRLNVNQLLNTPGSNWKLSGGLPHISYKNRYRRMRIGEDFGKLALNLQAVQIEGALLRVQRVKFQQWPSINFGLSNPPLYSSAGENDFSSDELLLFSGASKSVDLTDIGGRESIRDAKIRLKFTREQLRQRTEMEASRVLQVSSSYDLLLREERNLEREIRRLERPDSPEPEIVLKDLELRFDLELQLIETRRQIQQLDLQFLIWDESFWKS